METKQTSRIIIIVMTEHVPLHKICVVCEIILPAQPTLFSTPVQCPTLTNITNGVVMMDGTSLGSIASYMCDLDFQLEGASVRRCKGDGQWSGQPPECIRE